jgi:hypothetical protein
MITMKRGILVFGCAAAFAAAPLAVAPSAVAKECPYGTVATSFDGVCVQGQAGGFGAPGSVLPPQASPPGADIVANPNQIPSVEGIPCTPQHCGTCIGLQQSQG